MHFPERKIAVFWLDLHLNLFLRNQQLMSIGSGNDWCQTGVKLLLKSTDLSNKSQNAPAPYPTMLHSEQKCSHFCSEWSIVGYGTGAFWDMWNCSIMTQFINTYVHHHASICQPRAGFINVFRRHHSSFISGKWQILGIIKSTKFLSICNGN